MTTHAETAPAPTASNSDRQYTVQQVLGIWAAATIPMAALAWIVWPSLRNDTDLNPGMLPGALGDRTQRVRHARQLD